MLSALYKAVIAILGLLLLGLVSTAFSQPGSTPEGPTSQEVIAIFKEFRESITDQFLQCAINNKVLQRQLEKVKQEVEAMKQGPAPAAQPPTPKKP